MTGSPQLNVPIRSPHEAAVDVLRKGLQDMAAGTREDYARRKANDLLDSLDAILGVGRYAPRLGC